MSDNITKNKSGLFKKASKDFIFSVLALIIYNGVLQLLIYPEIEQRVGADAFGTVLYLISAVSVMGAGFGTAASYSRMMAKKNREETNGDYNAFLLIIAAISVPVTFVSLWAAEGAAFGLFLPVLVLMIVTVFRYYADVQYRMTIRFKEYFLFFVATSVGYVIGLLLYPVTRSWVFVILLGEVFGIVFTVITGTIFRAPFFNLSGCFKENMASAWFISGSNLVAALILHSDRILLRLLVAEERAVTIFYTASLVGKIVAMITTPLNGIVISYLTNYKIEMNKKRFAGIGALFMGLTVIGAAACCVVSMIFVKWRYPDIYEEASEFFFLANLGQLMYFISGSLMVILLAFTEEKLQLGINIIYGIAFAVIVIPATYFGGIVGISYGLVAVNAVRFILVIMLGVGRLGKNIKEV